MNLLKRVQQQVRTALTGLVDDPEPYVAMVRAAQDARFGDYQANCAMSLAKVLSQAPRQVAQTIVERLELGDLLEAPEIAGPGFINLRLRRDWLAAQVQQMARGERLGVEPALPPRTLVIDYSSPNVAKPMHVGHLRSTIIGDALARLFRFLGHKVITDNHLGDWGTQFGMLLYGYKHFRNDEALKADPVMEMLRLYVQVRNLIKPVEVDEEEEEDAAKDRYTPAQVARAREVREAARQETAKLHAGDAENFALWQQFIPWCRDEIDRIYQRLDVRFDYTHGESFYNPMLPAVVEDLEKRGLAQPSEGAIVVHFGEGQSPAIIRKRDGAFTYTTTDLATIRYRVQHWQPDTILYLVGSPQALHFRNLFTIARSWGYDNVELVHVPFGTVLRRTPEGKIEPFRTREAGAIELSGLLDDAIRRAGESYQASAKERLERGDEVPRLSAKEIDAIAEVVGVGAVKYADLSQNRTSDYVYSPEKMLLMDGNTATYMQYAYVRNRGIFRKGDIDTRPLREEPPLLSWDRPEERSLALQLLRFEETLLAAASEYKPSTITSYLWDLSKAYSAFFTNCPVLKAASPELRQSRLLLCDLTARVIQQGLHLLGIRTVERM